MNWSCVESRWTGDGGVQGAGTGGEGGDGGAERHTRGDRDKSASEPTHGSPEQELSADTAPETFDFVSIKDESIV